MALAQLEYKNRDDFMKRLYASTTFEIIDSQGQAQALRLPTVLVEATSHLLAVAQNHKKDNGRRSFTLKDIMFALSGKTYLPDGGFPKESIKKHHLLLQSYAEWVYTGTVKIHNEADFSFSEAWEFGLRIGAPAFQNAWVLAALEKQVFNATAKDVVEMSKDRPCPIFTTRTGDHLKLWQMHVDYIAHLGPEDALYKELIKLDSHAAIYLPTCSIDPTAYINNWKNKTASAAKPGKYPFTHPFAEHNKKKYLMHLEPVE